VNRTPWVSIGWTLVVLAPVGYAASAALALAGAVPVRVALAAGGGFAAAAFTTLLVRLALALPHGPCRGAGFLGMGVLAGGVGLVAVLAAPAALVGRAMTVGFLPSTVLFLLGLLLLPGTAPTWRSRLRRALDGVGMGTSLFFAGWLLVIVPLAGDGPGPAGPRATLAVLVWLVATAALVTAALVAVRARRYRRAAIRCAAGVCLSLLGQATLIVLLLARAPAAALLAAAGAMVAGPLLVWLGARGSGVTALPAHPSEGAGTFAGLPLLTVPVGLVIVASVYHLLTTGSFGRYSAVLGVVVVVAVAGREVFAVLDVRRYASVLAEQETRFRSIVSGSSDVTIVVDEGLVVRWQSPSAARRLGLADADVLGRPFTALFHSEDAPAVAEQLRRVLVDAPDRPAPIVAKIRDGFGGFRHTESAVIDHRAEPAVGGLVVHLRDVGERREMQRSLDRMAFADQLTGLPNRRALLAALVALADRADVVDRRACVLVVELDGLREINDTRGQILGDVVLSEAARRLRLSVSPDHLVARLGADTFAVLTPLSASVAQAIATRVLTVLAEPFELGDPPGTAYRQDVGSRRRMVLSASIGIAECSAGATPDELLAGADLAMRRARKQGRNRIARFDESLELAMMRRDLLESELPGVDRRGELDLLYQPIVAVADRRPYGAEALLRWRHPELGTLLPDEFVPIAEQAGRMGQLGSWALHQACRRLSGWLAEGRPVCVSVNVSARQLHMPDFVPEVATVLEAYEIPPERLMVEISERVITEDVQRVAARLADLRALGIRTAVDDFGAGYASLTHLRRLPVDVLKIDKALLADPLADVAVRLGDRLGLTVIAEGVETEDQLNLLREANCQYAQGYLFARPLTAEHTEAFFDESGTIPTS
jgi:diguanylate cyclase (GGDEF)-like protein/PAS domain S-box-containing protein